MKLIVRNRIELIKQKEFKVEEYLLMQMLENKKGKRKLWISGQNL